MSQASGNKRLQPRLDLIRRGLKGAELYDKAKRNDKCFIPNFVIPNPVGLTAEAQRRGV